MDDEITIHSSKESTKYIKWSLHSRLMEAEREAIKTAINNKDEAINIMRDLNRQLLNDKINALRNPQDDTPNEVETPLNDGQLLTIKIAYKRLIKLREMQQGKGLNALEYLDEVRKATNMIGSALEIIANNQTTDEEIKAYDNMRKHFEALNQVPEKRKDDPEQVQVKRPEEDYPTKTFLVKEPNKQYYIYEGKENALLWSIPTGTTYKPLEE